MGTLGNNLNTTICVAGGGALPNGWNPVHVPGFKPRQRYQHFQWLSVTQCLYYASPRNKSGMVVYSCRLDQVQYVLLDPLLAKDLRDQGFETKEKLCEWLSINAKTPAWLYWANRANELKQAKAGIEPFASYLKLGEESNIPVSSYLRKSSQGTPLGPGAATSIGLIVVGGGTNAYWAGSDFSYATSSSVDRWR
jgi:hypothetical protein